MNRVLTIFVLAGLAWTASAVSVQIDTGEIEGEASDSDPSVSVFRGIPFAAPPVGDLRWDLPQPVSQWEGVRDAKQFGPECLQPVVEEGLYSTTPAPQSEDCLYLNVWVSDDGADVAKKPVMVWIHGGAFIMGSGSANFYEGSALANRGVVVVTINYRLGIYGFFAHPGLTGASEIGASGNQGLHDQIAALRWEQRNAAAFGGDPDNVTIFGESAGSMSVCYLVASPLTKGLFHKAIGQSGGCMADHSSLVDDVDEVEPFAAPGSDPLNESGHEVGRAVAQALGAEGSDSESIKQLRAMSADALQEALQASGVAVPWRNIYVDGHMFPTQMRSLISNRRDGTIDVMVGSTRDEGTALFPWFEEAEPADWELSVRDGLAPRNAETVLAAYRDDAAKSTRTTSQEMLSDLYFAWEARKWATITTATDGTAYLYLFNHAPTLPQYGQALGAFHASEIAYVFGNRMFDDETDPTASSDGGAESDTIRGEWTEHDQAVYEITQSYWVNFARTGNPNGEGLPHWPEYDAQEDQLMEIKSEAEVQAGYRSEKLNAWEDLVIGPPQAGE